jgi:hypothetical protein
LSRAASSLLAASDTSGTAAGPLPLVGAAAALSSSDCRLFDNQQSKQTREGGREAHKVSG